MWEILQEKVYKTRITALELSTTPLKNGCRNDDVIQLGSFRSQSLLQFTVRSDQWCVFCKAFLLILTTCCNVITWMQIWQICGNSWSGINSGVSFCKNPMVARVRWAFQEILFRWGRKHLDHFAANLFRKRWIKFYENHQSFIQRTFWSIFSGHAVFW